MLEHVKEVRNIRYCPDSNNINCDVLLVDGSELPYTASENDETNFSKVLHKALVDGKYGPVDPPYEEDIRQLKEGIKQYNLEVRLSDVNRYIKKLKENLEDCEYGISDEDPSEIKKRIKTLVYFRRTLNELDLSTVDTVPEIPDF